MTDDTSPASNEEQEKPELKRSSSAAPNILTTLQMSVESILQETAQVYFRHV